MANAPTLIREIAKGPGSGETPSLQDPSSGATTGSVTGFDVPNRRPTTVDQQLGGLREFFQKAADGKIHQVSLEPILASSSDEF